MRKLLKKHKKFIFYTTVTVRMGGVTAFLFTHPFIAYFLNALFDMADGPIYKHIIKLEPQKSQLLDKIFDLWLYTTAATAVIYKLQITNYKLLIILYLYRLVGQTLFFATKNKRLLAYFPNFFEAFFLFFSFLDLTNNLSLVESRFFYPIGIFIAILIILHEISLNIKNETVFDDIILPLFKPSS